MSVIPATREAESRRLQIIKGQPGPLNDTWPQNSKMKTVEDVAQDLLSSILSTTTISKNKFILSIKYLILNIKNMWKLWGFFFPPSVLGINPGPGTC